MKDAFVPAFTLQLKVSGTSRLALCTSWSLAALLPASDAGLNHLTDCTTTNVSVVCMGCSFRGCGRTDGLVNKLQAKDLRGEVKGNCAGANLDLVQPSHSEGVFVNKTQLIDPGWKSPFTSLAVLR